MLLSQILNTHRYVIIKSERIGETSKMFLQRNKEESTALNPTRNDLNLFIRLCSGDDRILFRNYSSKEMGLDKILNLLLSFQLNQSYLIPQPDRDLLAFCTQRQEREGQHFTSEIIHKCAMGCASPKNSPYIPTSKYDSDNKSLSQECDCISET